MQKHLILFFLALFGLTACVNKAKPDYVVEKDKMTRLLVDVHLIDGSLATQLVRDSLYKYGTSRYQQLFKQYGIDSGIFKKSLKYYAAQPDELITIYDSVTAILNAKSASLTLVQQKQGEKDAKKNAAAIKATTDSVKRRQLKDSIKRDSLRKARFNMRRQPGKIN